MQDGPNHKPNWVATVIGESGQPHSQLSLSLSRSFYVRPVNNDQSRPYVAGPAPTRRAAIAAASILALQDLPARGLPVPVAALIALGLPVPPAALQVTFPTLDPTADPPPPPAQGQA